MQENSIPPWANSDSDPPPLLPCAAGCGRVIEATRTREFIFNAVRHSITGNTWTSSASEADEWLASVCDQCEDRQAAERKAEDERKHAVEREERRAASWLKICPLIYRDTDLSHRGLCPIARRAVEGWRFGPTGLGLVGPTGRGKTRLAFQLLKREHLAGRHVIALRHSKFAHFASTAFDDKRAREILGRARRADIFYLDDLGKAPVTERSAAELEDLVEERTSSGRPVIWSANGGGAWLEDRFGPDRGEPLCRRLKEFTEIHVLPRE